MSERAKSVPELLDQLEAHYGVQQPEWPTDPFEFLVWWHCGYPASDAACNKGWKALGGITSIDVDSLLAVSTTKLADALRAGGMVPELRAVRLKEIAERVKNEHDGDLRSSLSGTVEAVRKQLKKFPNIADPGADRIMLFGRIAPIAAVPSNCPHVLVRIRRGFERENYSVTYKEAQQELRELPQTFESLTRSYLLLKQHGQRFCNRTKPKCDECPVSSACAYFHGKTRGRSVALGSK
jgi:endonuclease III